MMKTHISIGMSLVLSATCMMASGLYAAPVENIVKLKTKTGTLEGSLMIPAVTNTMPVALIIAGSGPTDRDGNNLAMRNNCSKSN